MSSSPPPSDVSSGGGADGGGGVPGTASSNFTLLYIIIAVLVGVILYMAIRYGRSVMSEWRQLHVTGGGGEPRAALLGLSSDDIESLPTFTYRASGGGASPALVGGGGSRKGKGKAVVVECVVCLQELADGDVLRRCGLSPERPTTAASRVLADILASRSPPPPTSPSPVQAAISYVASSRSPSPATYHRSPNDRWSTSPATQMPEVVVVRSKSPSPSPVGLSRQASAATARGVGAATSASSAQSQEGGGSRSKSPSPVPH
uniref:Uncharacterized protein n=1 Tax=Leersia perrieri TaxID=77586 RepID=A0A0D9WQX6_9ORYZ